MLLWSAVIGAFASAGLAVAVSTSAPMWTMFIAMAGMGAYTGASNPASESLFADSVQTGSRYGATHISPAFPTLSSFCKHRSNAFMSSP